MTIRVTTDGEGDLPRYFARVFAMACEMAHGRIDFVLPDGRRFRAQGNGPGPVAEMVIVDADVFARIIREGDLGFSEAYLDGSWTTPDLQAFMDLVHAGNEATYDAFGGMALVRFYENLRFWWQSNSKRQAKRNIRAHYDLGNDFYKLWLDDSMTYSSAFFETGQEPLEKAQIAKYAMMVDAIGAQPGDHVLEIGCGWGGFAEYAAGARGLKVTGVTISKEQHAYATARMERAGLQDRVDIRLQDYRDIEGTFDGIASIEMFEAVGEKYWPIYFDTLRDRLKPGANATLQVITVREERWNIYRKSVDFIQKYIFPGGLLPPPSLLRSHGERAGLGFVGSTEFGQSYSVTARRWHETFNEKWDEIARLGFDERFRRMWNFYLTSCVSNFGSGSCDVTQVTFNKPV